MEIEEKNKLLFNLQAVYLEKIQNKTNFVWFMNYQSMIDSKLRCFAAFDKLCNKHFVV